MRKALQDAYRKKSYAADQNGTLEDQRRVFH